jgi:integrase
LLPCGNIGQESGPGPHNMRPVAEDHLPHFVAASPVISPLAGEPDKNFLVIVRLACCWGLRVSEIASVQLDDVVVDVPRPHLRLRRETTKGKKARMVPLWWDAGMLADLVAWKAERGEQGARGDAAFVCSVQAHRRGEAIQRHAIRLRFLSACKVLGLARIRMLTIHHGRHTVGC